MKNGVGRSRPPTSGRPGETMSKRRPLPDSNALRQRRANERLVRLALMGLVILFICLLALLSWVMNPNGVLEAPR